MDKRIIQLGTLNRDEVYDIGVKKKEKKPPFTMTGDKMEALDIVANFSKPEAMAFILLKAGRDWKSNYTNFSTGELKPTDKVVFSKGYKALAEKDVVIRVKKGITSQYMFNPDFIVPNEYEKAVVEWNKIKI